MSTKTKTAAPAHAHANPSMTATTPASLLPHPDPTVTAAATGAVLAAAPIEPLRAELLTPSMEHYNAFLPAAMAIPATDVRIPRISLRAALANAARGVAALQAHQALVAALPNSSIDKIASLAPLGSALAYAANIVDRYSPIVGSTKAAATEARTRRATLLIKADVLVVDGIVPASVVADIRKGRGLADTAEDCVALAALFVQYKAALPGRVQLSEADILAADAIGETLRATLRTNAAKRAPSPTLVAATDARDRLWTLFEQTWEDHVWPAGAYVFKRAGVDAQVPLLHTRVGKRRVAKGTTPAPASPPAQPVVPTEKPAAAA